MTETGITALRHGCVHLHSINLRGCDQVAHDNDSDFDNNSDVDSDDNESDDDHDDDDSENDDD